MPEPTIARGTPRRTRIRRTILSLLFAGLIAALFVVGCRPGSDEPEENAAPFHESNAEVLLNIGVERGDDLGDAVNGITIEVPGHESWQANLAYGGDTETFGHFPVGDAHAFTIYPEGPTGPAIEVPFTMKPTMVSGTASSKTYVTVHRDSIVVRGPAIPGEREAFAW